MTPLERALAQGRAFVAWRRLTDEEQAQMQREAVAEAAGPRDDHVKAAAAAEERGR